jgi:hypothetical protein
MFDTLNRMQQGDLGEARAQYELCRLGYYVSRPVHVHLPYDFIAEKDGILYRVQVKTSGMVQRESTQTYSVGITTTGGNRLINTRKRFDPDRVELLFIMAADDRCWLIPVSEISSRTNITVGTERYAKYQISGPVVQRVVLEKESTTTIPKPDMRLKEPPFSKDQLQELLYAKTTVDIGAMFGMSDNGVARWAKKWGLNKPPRGYWQKIAAGPKRH